jgi:hypothetical protein
MPVNFLLAPKNRIVQKSLGVGEGRFKKGETIA